MGLSSKQVSSDGLDWNKLLQTGALDMPKDPQLRTRTQTQQQQSPPLRCPRCDSNNTKFCYYNNYNRSQPRHFCKACRRHWTKGGTLRNVPVGGGRKNKRLKTTTSTPTTSLQGTNTIAIQQQQQQMPLGLGLSNQKTISDILYNSLIHQPPPVPHPNNSNTFMGSLLSLPPMPHFPLTSFDNTDPSSNSISLQSPFLSTITQEAEDPPPLSLPLDLVQGSDTRTPTPWQIPTSNLLDSSCWSWDDFTNFVSQPLPGSQFP